MMETVQSTYQPQLHQVTSGFYMDIATDLKKFLAVKFPCSGVPFFVNWCTSFRKLLEDMLNETPASRPKASEVWERLKEMAEALGTKPHCEYVSPVVEYILFLILSFPVTEPAIESREIL